MIKFGLSYERQRDNSKTYGSKVKYYQGEVYLAAVKPFVLSLIQIVIIGERSIFFDQRKTTLR